jgi:UDP-glucose 4-epimerase
MNVGVTGANGFVGHRAVSALRAHGHRVVPFARTNLASDAHQLDLAIRPLPEGVFDGLEAVVHTAAYLPASYSDASEAQRCMDINALGTLAVLNECARAGVKKIVHLSTNLYRLSDHAVAEDAPFEPSAQATYYLVSKAAADFFASQPLGHCQVTILRLGSVYGPHMQRGLISLLTNKLLAGSTISVEDGRYQADFVHVEDVATVVVAAVESAHSGPFNIGCGQGLSPLDIATRLVRATGAPQPLLEKTAPATHELRGFSALDVARARSLLGFNPRSIDDGLDDYVRWRREQP